MGDGAAQALLGGEPDEVPDRYTDADPIRLLPGDVPVTLIQGTQDKEVTVEMNRRLAADHPTINYVELDGIDHFALIDPLSPVFEQTVLPALS
jgi:pimeloyl-ACP methyl ester carboxylesterase